MIADLSEAADLRAFNQGILDIHCKVVAAEYGALWMKDRDGEIKMVEGWPSRMTENPQALPVWQLLTEAAKGGFERDASHVLKVEPEDSSEAPGVGAHVFVTVLRVRGKIAAVSTVVADCRDPMVLQSTVPMRELAAGLYELFFVKQEVGQHQKEADRIRSAMAVLATAQDGPGFKGACLNLVNELARQLKCSRVSLGWIKGRRVILQAMSDTEDLKRHSEQVGQIELAMAEALDQQHPVVCPPPEDAEPLLAQAIVHAHRRVASASGQHHIVSIPLRKQDEWLGVLTLERTETPFDSDLVAHLQLIADVIAPELHDRRETDRWLVGHTWRSIRQTAAFLVGPKYVGWKLVGIAASVLALFLLLGTWSYKVTSEFVLEIESKRVVSGAFESDLIEVAARPGDTVRAGQVLARLNAVELELELADWISRRNLAILEGDKARTEAGKQSEVQQAAARAAQAQARIDLLQYRIEKAVIRAPIDGVILAGDWRDRVGVVVPQGEPMFEVAPLDDIIAVLRVNESDIDQLQAYQQEHQRLPAGRLATRAEPEIKFDIQIQQIVPLAEPHNNTNVFEVRAALLNSEPWLRPGMEGIAHLEVGDRPIIWILTHRLTDMIRLWMWW